MARTYCDVSVGTTHWRRGQVDWVPIGLGGGQLEKSGGAAARIAASDGS